MARHVSIPVSSRRRIRLKWLIVNPLATAVLLGALGGVVDQTASDATHRMRAQGAFIPELRLPITDHTDIRGEWSAIRERYAILHGSDLRLADPDRESWDEVTRLISQDPGSVLLLRIHHGHRERGLWAVTAVDDVYFVTTKWGEDFSESERMAARELAVALLTRDVPSEIARALGKQDVERHATRWWGYGIDAATLLLLAGFLYSLTWLPAVPALTRAYRTRRLLARNLCPSCRYSLAGLDSAVCPECGRPIHPDAPNLK